MKRSRLSVVAAMLAALLVLTVGPSASGRPGPSARVPSTGRTDLARVAKAAPALATVERDALSRALARGAIDEATYALERARSLFDLAGVRERYGAVRRADPRGATLILRDLVARFADLSAGQRREARAILARPTDGGSDPFGDGYTVVEATPLCSTNGCVHYVTSTGDAPALTDLNLNGIPDYVESARDTLEQVWATEVTAYGYRAPKSDLTSVNNGGNALIDVYVTELGDQGLYGYCTTDDPNAFSGLYLYYDFSAYCVVDNNYDPAQFPPPAANGIAGLQVTMAHEFFHAVQYAYDALEDTWFMESTSTWMEDEVYDAVNDNWQYFPASPLETPDVPLDYNGGFNVYGDWIFPRYVSESSPAHQATIRRAWEFADASALGSDQYSLRAYASAIAEAAPGTKFRWVFADFAMYNNVPDAFYEEGVDYPIPPPERIFKVTKANGGTNGVDFLDHLTSRYYWFRPARGVQDGAKLWVYMDGPGYATGPEASVVVFYTNGNVKFFPLSVNKKGAAEIVVPFGRSKISEVDLVMTNASMRKIGGDCWVDPNWDYACAAYPADDGRMYEYWAVLLQ